MRRCLDLAARAAGATSPNPMVGAVIARGGRVLAEAYHRRAGGPHAEVTALRIAGAAARGATLYANLEPCSHYGRTPPCIDAILAAGVRRVVASMKDPFGAVNGRGFSALRRAGVKVETGLLRGEAARLNERYLTWVTRRRPFVTLKAAMTLDGRIATSSGASRWISSARSRSEAHALRAMHDAVMVGANTVSADDPRLTARRGEGPRSGLRARQPMRVVLDARLRIGPRARILAPPGGPVIVYTSPTEAKGGRARRLERRGAEIVPLPGPRHRRRGSVDIVAALRDLAHRGVTSVLVEGGGEMFWSALEARVADRIVLFVAPIIVGGRDAVPLVGGRGVRRPGLGFRIGAIDVRRIGEDLVLEARIARRG